MSKWFTIAVILAAIAVATTADAQLMITNFGEGSTGGAPPGACSNKLDFSDACNSQYIGVIQ